MRRTVRRPARRRRPPRRRSEMEQLWREMLWCQMLPDIPLQQNGDIFSAKVNGIELQWTHGETVDAACQAARIARGDLSFVYAFRYGAMLTRTAVLADRWKSKLLGTVRDQPDARSLENR